MSDAKKRATPCENCLHYEWDDDAGGYVCNVCMDEDDSERLARGTSRGCPYFTFYDEYLTVRKQN